jgi:hypothetical protein
MKKKTFTFELFPFGTEVLIMELNKIQIAFVKSARVTTYESGGGIEYLLYWQDEEGENHTDWTNAVYVFEDRESLIAQL